MPGPFSEDSSGERRRQGAVNKCGNPRVRHLVIKAAWRLPYSQSVYAPVRKLRRARRACPQARRRRDGPPPCR